MRASCFPYLPVLGLVISRQPPVLRSFQLPVPPATKPQSASVQEQQPVSSAATHQPTSAQGQLPVPPIANPQPTSVQEKLQAPPAAKSQSASTHNQLPVPPVVKGQPKVQEAQEEPSAPDSNAGSALQGLTDAQKAAAILRRKEEKPVSAVPQVSAHENGPEQENNSVPKNASASENVSIQETGE